jgi:uncharacterized spore protein YtfJ
MDVRELLTRASEGISAGRAFGPAYRHGDTTIIPVAFVAGGGGGGSGEVPSPADARPDEAPEQPRAATAAQGSGSGGGFGGVSWPIGVYVVRDDNVTWVPALDATRIALSALGLVKLISKLLASRRSRAR